jgi:uncharacterized DUF497 family protein
MEFDWDGGNWPKCGKHGLSKEEIEFVLESDPLIYPDAFPAETRFNAVGVTKVGRLAFVVYTMRNDKFRPISARFIHTKVKNRYV